jgi:APA family basic amino acid/polyamine antiporter
MWAQFVWAAALALSGTYGKLLDYIVFTSLIFYIVTMWGLIRLAGRIPQKVNMTRPVDYVVPVLYILGAVYIAFFLLFGDFFTPDFATRFATWDAFKESKFFTSIAGLGLTALGLPVYWCWKKAKAA